MSFTVIDPSALIVTMFGLFVALYLLTSRKAPEAYTGAHRR